MVAREKRAIMKTFMLTLVALWISRANGNRLQQVFTEAGKKLSDVKNMATQMATDLHTKVTMAAGGINVQSKVEVVQKKWNNAVQEYNNDRAVGAGKIKDAVAGVGTGLVSFVQGIKNEDWVTGVQGALAIISSVVALAGPVGVIASGILSFLSSVFSLFGGAKKTESMDSKIERLVSKQIDIARQKDLEAQVQGFKLSYESLSDSIQDFREGKELETDQANELYNQAFLGLSILGKFQARINEICDDLNDHVNASKCLKTMALYADMSIIRQLALADMAALLADVYHRKVDDEPILEEIPSDEAIMEEAVEDTPEEKQKKLAKARGLLVISNNLLHLIKKEQEKDRKFLRFLGDPFNHPFRRYVISIYFATPDKYPSLKAYVRTLHKVVPGGFFMDYVMICTSDSLKGTCKIMFEGNYNQLENRWHDGVKSCFVPLGLQLTAYQRRNLNEHGKIFGPFAGPIAHNKAPGGDDWSSAKVEETTNDAERQVRICSEQYFNPGYCDTVEPADLINLWNQHGYKWDQNISSMYIPKGLAVDAYTEINKGGNHYEWFVGPHLINIVYDENKWQSLWIRDAGELDASNQVWFCDERNLQGRCKTTWKSLYYLPGSYNMNWTEKISSLKVPGGYQVTGYTDIDHGGIAFGPYSGPSVISQVDGENQWKSMVVSEFRQVIPDSTSDGSQRERTKHSDKKKQTKLNKQKFKKGKGKEKQF